MLVTNRWMTDSNEGRSENTLLQRDTEWVSASFLGGRKEDPNLEQVFLFWVPKSEWEIFCGWVKSHLRWCASSASDLAWARPFCSPGVLLPNLLVSIWAACSHKQFAIPTLNLENGNGVLSVSFLLPKYKEKRKLLSTGVPSSRWRKYYVKRTQNDPDKGCYSPLTDGETKP